MGHQDVAVAICAGKARQRSSTSASATATPEFLDAYVAKVGTEKILLIGGGLVQCRQGCLRSAQPGQGGFGTLV